MPTVTTKLPTNSYVLQISLAFSFALESRSNRTSSCIFLLLLFFTFLHNRREDTNRQLHD